MYYIRDSRKALQGGMCKHQGAARRRDTIFQGYVENTDGGSNQARTKLHRTNHVCKGTDDSRDRTRTEQPPYPIFDQ